MSETQTPQLPTLEVAHTTIVGIHKQAFLGRLRQHGEMPETEKEAAALVDLGIDLFQNTSEDELTKSASADFDYGKGPYALAKAAHDQFVGGEIAPGFPKESSHGNNHVENRFSDFEPGLVDATYSAAQQLAGDPNVYGAAVVKRAENEKVAAELSKQATAPVTPAAASA